MKLGIASGGDVFCFSLGVHSGKGILDFLHPPKGALHGLQGNASSIGGFQDDILSTGDLYAGFLVKDDFGLISSPSIVFLTVSNQLDFFSTKLKHPVIGRQHLILVVKKIRALVYMLTAKTDDSFTVSRLVIHKYPVSNVRHGIKVVTGGCCIRYPTGSIPESPKIHLYLGSPDIHNLARKDAVSSCFSLIGDYGTWAICQSACIAATSPAAFSCFLCR